MILCASNPVSSRLRLPPTATEAELSTWATSSASSPGSPPAARSTPLRARRPRRELLQGVSAVPARRPLAEYPGLLGPEEHVRDGDGHNPIAQAVVRVAVELSDG